MSESQTALFCSPNMVDMFEVEKQTKYLRTTPLAIDRIDGGIIHPLEWAGEKIVEDSFYGGVTDSILNFNLLSLTKRVSPSKFKWSYQDWFFGAKPGLNLSEMPYVDEDVVFIGALSDHYGHFILEGLSRLWIYLEEGDWTKKAVYISESGDCRFKEFFYLFGLTPDKVTCIKVPTRFRSVQVPEQSIRLHDTYHGNYKKTIDKIKKSVIPVTAGSIFFSKKTSKSSRAIGENFLEGVLAKNNYFVKYPESLGAYETVSLLMGCKEFLASSGTNAHNAIFLPDGAKLVCMNRSAHFHPIQTMINDIRCLKTTYVDLFLFSSDVNFGDAPCYLFPTKYLFDFFNFRHIKYQRLNIYKSIPIDLLKYLVVRAKWFAKRTLAKIYEKMFGWLKNKKFLMGGIHTISTD